AVEATSDRNQARFLPVVGPFRLPQVLLPQERELALPFDLELEPVEPAVVVEIGLPGTAGRKLSHVEETPRGRCGRVRLAVREPETPLKEIAERLADTQLTEEVRGPPGRSRACGRRRSGRRHPRRVVRSGRISAI